MAARGEFRDELIATAVILTSFYVLLTHFECLLQSAIASPGKGILAADESTGTMGKRYALVPQFV